MKLYLSSYELGTTEFTDQLQTIAPANKKIGYIFNALDVPTYDPARRQKRIDRNVAELSALGFEVSQIDLRDYFGKEEELRVLVNTLGGIFASGGNVFILRQAYALSGFDTILLEKNTDSEFLYGGYSAAGCVLSETLDGDNIVDDPNIFPYTGISETIWEGLGIIDYKFLPHFESDHNESAMVGKEVAYCIEKGYRYRTLRDGEVIIEST